VSTAQAPAISPSGYQVQTIALRLERYGYESSASAIAKFVRNCDRQTASFCDATFRSEHYDNAETRQTFQLQLRRKNSANFSASRTQLKYLKYSQLRTS
jgi:hypothetical protein